MSQPKRATLYDVARHAGVSYQTVSRVINGNPHVAAATLVRVQSAIRALDYQPNSAARTLVTRRSFTLELIMLGAEYYGPAQMMNGVERAAKTFGYKLLYSNIAQESPEAVRTLIDNLDSVDGLIVIAPLQDAGFDALLARSRKPFVKIGTKQGAPTPSVIIDQRYGSQLAVQHLIDLGHRHIAEISGALHWHDAAARHEAWHSALHSVGLKTDLSVQGDWTAQGGYTAAQSLIARGEPFSALVAANDQMALGALRALREHGLRIPDEVSLVGFDDIPEAAYFEPPLTTVRQDFRALGQASVEYLVEIIAADAVPPADPTKPISEPLYQRVQYPQLIVRHSTRAVHF